MSTKRRESVRILGKGPNGRNLCCCGCGREVVRPRINWFSDACVRAWKLRNNPATIRHAVFDRDHGICALCGIDCEREGQIRDETINLWRWLAHREAERLEELGQLPAPPNGYPESVFFWAHRWVNEDITAKGWKDYGHTWEADHVVPVVEGGGQCGLDNFRTLCLSCHRKETAKLLRRRAEQRRIVPGQLAFAQ